MATIQKINDRFRASGFRGGEACFTQGVAALPPRKIKQLVNKVIKFKNFNENNDPYEEHDFGSITQNGVLYFWKIDYYNQDMTGGSEDPSDEKQTKRILTLMEAREY
jgi:hypothetical protein